VDDGSIMSKRRILGLVQNQMVGLAEITPVIAASAWLGFRIVDRHGWSGELTNDVAYAVFGLLLIWFRRPLGRYVGPSRYGYIGQPTPPALIAAAGWFSILGMPVILYAIQKTSL
jgi:hypothetical protein